MRTATVMVDPSLVFENPRLRTAYISLQAWNRPSTGSDLVPLSLFSFTDGSCSPHFPRLWTGSWPFSHTSSYVLSHGRNPPTQIRPVDLSGRPVNAHGRPR
ncbi:hypothetical protein L1987_50182 [Smallanthus sonchifolius]|uniref:Uncharacterized protein n=1 Tax=Smallanthus sonchifolius TaxID=185202 RepID=A0ACB9FYF6_9ASTR|nr:hypothetical protein L1987_50182 [Smallanthus sonchifolius]